MSQKTHTIQHGQRMVTHREGSRCGPCWPIYAGTSGLDSRFTQIVWETSGVARARWRAGAVGRLTLPTQGAMLRDGPAELDRRAERVHVEGKCVLKTYDGFGMPARPVGGLTCRATSSASVLTQLSHCISVSIMCHGRCALIDGKGWSKLRGSKDSCPVQWQFDWVAAFLPL